MIVLKKNAVYGVSWTTLEYIVIVLLQIVQLIVLTRILTPVDFGFIAIGTIFTTFGNSVFALGLGPALIQMRDNYKEYLNTAWTANLAMSAIASLLLIIFAPFIIVTFFDLEEAIIPTIVLISVVFISGLNNSGMVTYMRNIEINKLFIFHVLPKFIGVIIVIIASLLLKNYWGIVIGIIVEFILKAILSFILIDFRPRLSFDYQKFKQLYNFGGWLQLKNIIQWLASNIDVAIIGSLVSTTMLGFYNRASSLAKLPEAQINKVVNTISFPLYSSVQSNHEKLQKSVKLNNDFVLILLVPFVTISFTFPEEFISMLFGSKWLIMVDPFKYLVLAICIKAYIMSFTPLLRSIGFPKYEFVFNLIKIVVLLIILYPFTSNYGITGSAIAILLSSILAAPYVFYKISSVTKFNFNDLIFSICFSLIFMSTVILSRYLLIPEQLSPFYFISFSLLVLASYFIIAYFVFRLFKSGPYEAIITALKVYRS